jgi:hypothetical protein
MIKYHLLQVRSAGKAGNFTVIIGQSSVLGNLGSVCGIDDTCLWSDNDVWHRWISLGITVSKIGRAIAWNNVVDHQVMTAPVQVVNRSIKIALVFKKDESNVVSASEANGDPNVAWNQMLTDLSIFGGVDW